MISCIRVLLMHSLATLPDVGGVLRPLNQLVLYHLSQVSDRTCSKTKIHPHISQMDLSDKAVSSVRIGCSRKILVAFVYIYCLLECFYVWVFSVSCRNVGVFSSAIWLVAREPTTLAVFYLHF